MYYLEKRKNMRYFLYNRSIYNRCIALLFSIFSFTVLVAQVSQHGVIKDTNGKLLSGVIITIQESTISAESNESGEFSIPSISGDNLTFALDGYQTTSNVVDQDLTKMDVTMQELKFGN